MPPTKGRAFFPCVCLSSAALIAVLLPWPNAPAADRPGDVVTGELGARLDEFLGRLADWGFSGSVLVAKGGDVALARGYGLADRENKRPFTADTVSCIGSVTKQFTAAAILKLEMQGKLSVNDPLGKYFKDVPADKEGITLHHLLTHSAGLASDFGDDYEKISRDEIVRRALGSKLQSKPGARYSYSNAGYSLLGAVVEIVSGQGYEAYLHENLFVPAGMNQTGYRIPRWRPEELAQGYQRGRRWGTPLDHPWAQDGPYWMLRANGGILSTVNDMYRWHRALEGKKVLSRAAKEKLFAPHVRADETGTQFYGYGWSVGRSLGGKRLIGHNGSNGIFFAEVRRYPDDGVYLCYLTNVDELVGGQVGRWIDRILFGGKVPAPPTVARDVAPSADKVAGTYRLSSGGRLRAGVRDGRLTIEAEGADAFALLVSGQSGDPAALKVQCERTAAIHAARMKGDCEPLHKALGGRVSLARLQQVTAQTRKELEDEHGPYRAFAVLGSAATDDSRDTYVRVTFARGAVVLRYVWDKDRLQSVRLVPSAPSARTFLPQSGTQFAAFSVAQPTLVQVRFALQGTGPATELAVRTPEGEVVARRVGS
jgi:CubicO group peptidase (beta-lactamase class C family)